MTIDKDNLGGSGAGNGFDVVCFSHLRWDFVFQRPQHLMNRFAADGRVFVIEEPVHAEGEDTLDVSDRGNGVFVCVPRLTHIPSPIELAAKMAPMVAEMLEQNGVDSPVAWFYTPMMLHWADAITPRAVVYDCMDELSHFKGAPPELIENEKELFERADVVFTGGQSLYEKKREQHANAHAFPSSIDKDHFGKARTIRSESGRTRPERPVVGFVGVIDERFDVELLAKLAEMRPDLDIRMVGPVVKIDEADLPRNENITYLGQKTYDELPELLADWDVAMMPFAINDATKYISPTKTPEFLAAGLPVVSTAITDVVRPYKDESLVEIEHDAAGFSAAIDRLLAIDREELFTRVDAFLADKSWDNTYSAMREQIERVAAGVKAEAAA